MSNIPNNAAPLRSPSPSPLKQSQLQSQQPQSPQLQQRPPSPTQPQPQQQPLARPASPSPSASPSVSRSPSPSPSQSSTSSSSNNIKQQISTPTTGSTSNTTVTSTTTTTTASSQTLAEKFASACFATPPPTLVSANLPSATPQELQFLLQNPSGDIFMAPQAVYNDAGIHNPAHIASAIRKALQHSSAPIAAAAAMAVAAAAGLPLPDDSSVEQEPITHQPTDLSFLELIEAPSFMPLPSLLSFDWPSSTAKKVLDRFNEHARSTPPSSPTSSPTSSVSGTATAATLTSHPKASSHPAPLSPPAPPVDTVVLAAQQEAAANSVLRDVRAAHVRSRKSTSSFRKGETPVWALLAQRGGKLKPEAAAEMARARIAAAAAAAVMRDADADHAPANQNRPFSNDPLSPTPINSRMPYISEMAENDQDFLHQFESPRFLSSSHLPEARLNLRPPQRAPRPSSVDVTTSRFSHAVSKKRVVFAEGTIFHEKK